MGTWRSPNEMFKAAKDMMLQGREPKTEEDWMKLVNFFAVNIADGLELPAVLLLCKIFDVPLTEKQITYIVMKQIESKAKDRLKRAKGNGGH